MIAAALLTMAFGCAGVLPVEAAIPVSSDAAGQAQAVLDRVLGPGNAVVEVAATVHTGSTQVDTVRYGSARGSSAATARWTSAGGTTASSAQVDAVDQTSTSTVVPAGGVVRQTVSVAIDRTALGSTPVARLRRLVAAAVGLVPARGDRLTVVVTAFARPVTATAPQRPWSAVLLPLAVPALQIGGALAGLLILLRMLGLGRRRRDPVLRRS